MTHMELDTFINREIDLWGEDYIVSLLDQGYTPVMSDRGPKWFLPIQETSENESKLSLA